MQRNILLCYGEIHTLSFHWELLSALVLASVQRSLTSFWSDSFISFNNKLGWIWKTWKLLNAVEKKSCFSLLQTEARKVIRLTSLDRSGSANILKNNSSSNLWPLGSIINSVKRRGSQTALPGRRKFLVFVMFAFCLLVCNKTDLPVISYPFYSTSFGDIHFYCQFTVSSVFSYSI